MAKLRLALTISGAVSLGAYEGGVLAGLLNAIRPLSQGADPTVRLDVIGGASAGSMTGLLAARALTAGIDPVYVMKQAWVQRDSIQAMLHGHQDAPLSSDVLRAMVKDLIEVGPDHRVLERQNLPVSMVMVVADLRGLAYEIRGGSAAQPTDAVEATTYLDLVSFTVRGDWGVDDFLNPVDASPVDAALASGANALGFPPKLLDRSHEAQAYRDMGLSLPESGCLWYTDGGTLDNEPLGHTLDLVAALDGDLSGGDRRLHLLIHPHPAAPPSGDAWADPGDQPTWVQTLIRADHLQRTQSLYDDLRRVAKTNTRIHWARVLAGATGPAMAALPPERRGELAASFRRVVDAIDEERAALPGHRPVAAGAPPHPAPDDASAWLQEAVSRVAGIGAKTEMDIDVISPLVLPSAKTTPVEHMLAGEILFHFGGFFDEGMRSSDFDLGYSSALEWLRAGALPRHGLDPADSQRALEAAEGAYQPQDLWEKWGQTTLADVTRHHPLALAGLVTRLARVVGHDVITRHGRQSS